MEGFENFLMTYQACLKQNAKKKDTSKFIIASAVDNSKWRLS